MLLFARRIARTKQHYRRRSQRKNYRLIKPGAMGTSHGFKLLGIFPLASPHHSTARSKLYASVDQPLTGKAVALTNELEDKSTL